VSGEVVEINEAVVDEPARVNESPYETGWLIKIRPSDPSALERELDALLDSEAYAEHTA
jgi:glycine cleavage system H protein